MTEKERYETILNELAEVIRDKNDKISYQSFVIMNLEAKLKEAEDAKNDAE